MLAKIDKIKDRVTDEHVLSGRGSQLIVDRVNKRQSNMVSGRVNEWTSKPVACEAETLSCSPMKDEITGDQCQTCQKDEINHHSFEF